VSRYQKGKKNLDFTEARDSEWQWHQLGHMQACTLLQTDNHANTPPLVFYRPDALPSAHRRQRHRGHVPDNIWSAGDEVSYIPAKFVKFLLQTHAKQTAWQLISLAV